MVGLNSIGGAFLAAALVVLSHAGHAQDWPNRPVKVVVPFAAAGTTDRLGRLAAEELSKTFKQQFYVENRPGGGGVIGAVQVARAEPDGYTLMIGGYGPHIFAPATTANLGYDVMADFTHIAMIGGESFIIVAHPALGVKSFADLTELAKSRTGPLNMASPGQATLGALVVSRRFAAAAMASAALAATAVQGLGLAIPAVWPVFAVALLSFCVGGIGHGVKNVLVRTLIHDRVPDELRGRAFAAYNGIRNGAELIALLAGGLLLSVLAPRWILLLAGGISALVALIALVVARRRAALAPEAPPVPTS